jgi:hypothetical protein
LLSFQVSFGVRSISSFALLASKIRRYLGHQERKLFYHIHATKELLYNICLAIGVGADDIAHYNEVHPHKALGYRSPREFIAAHARP